ncbi:protein TIC236, chloroplastic-like [Macadamia integrifolia]|uniref:protein TIC236, chloroplastic-like n=1 Tax=Macadamia integrifolia TaxID=60698 RepID=UPI001C50188F|nr:protein TIC236, chloroplastic-like [Macadamia integrifolia]XP_042477495.1 protein TIC236, chloroplastic-like [Macadamia integrifolia]XP_042477502.1 protein TIC236, chloroplastic-like [Macadamia integrifolia]
MSIEHLHSPFIGFQSRNAPNMKSNVSFTFVDRRRLQTNTFPKFYCAKQNHGGYQGIWLSVFNGREIELLSSNIWSRSRLKMNRTWELISQSKSIVRSLDPLWKEGLLFIRCSIFFAVISALGMLVWYGQVKARSLVEARFLPSVCSVLSEHLQRELDFGKVRSISPFGITLESCSIGPQHEEFSCSEVFTMRLRICPFASLRRGRIVIDAVLSQPSVLIVQKEDFSWLGIPSSEGALQRHSSTEEGIDNRTKTRRVAKEEAAARWSRERDEAARRASETGYIFPQQCSSSSEVNVLKEDPGHSNGLATSESFFCVDEQMHWRDHHCMDTGIEYGLKHADLEKSFGVKKPSTNLKFWSKMISPIKHRFKRKTRDRDISEADAAAKRRNLERSAVAALAYFRGGKFGEPSQFVRPSAETLVTESVDNHNATRTGVNNAKCRVYDDQYVEADFKGVKIAWHESLENASGYSIDNLNSELVDSITNDFGYQGNSGFQHLKENKHTSVQKDNGFRFLQLPFLTIVGKLKRLNKSNREKLAPSEKEQTDEYNVNIVGYDRIHVQDSTRVSSNSLPDQITESFEDRSEGCRGGHTSEGASPTKLDTSPVINHAIPIWYVGLKSGLPSFSRAIGELLSNYFAGSIEKLKSSMGLKVEDLVVELTEGVDEVQTEGIEKILPVTLDSVYFTGGSLMLLAYGDQEPREMDNVSGHVKFQNHYGRVHVQLSGACKTWRSNTAPEDGGWLSADVFVDSIEQKWHANLKIVNLFVPLFERILEIPITWTQGRASGELHICMSRGETFPNLHGQIDVKGLTFQIFDAPSCFSEMAASLCFRGQRIFLYNACGWFGDASLEASGDFGINPEDGEFHLMSQVPCVEVNALMKTFNMKPLLFPLAGSVNAVFNCQGPLDAPIFVGSGMVSRKTAHSLSEFPPSSASEAVMKNKEAGAVAAFDRVPFSYLSANFTFNTDNCVADLYGIRGSLLDGGEIRGAGNAWICPEGEVDDTAMDVNFSGNMPFDKILYRYIPGEIQLIPFKMGELNGETKLSGSLLRPRFDIKWVAPKAEGSFSDARGDIIISHDYITVNSSSIAFDFYTRVQTSYPDEYWLNRKVNVLEDAMPFIIEGVDLDFRMRGFEFFSLMSSYPFDSPRPVHLKATGRIKFQGKVLKATGVIDEEIHGVEENFLGRHMTDNEKSTNLVGEVSLSGIKLNQLTLAPQLIGSLSMSRKNIKLDATGRPDESLGVEVIGPLWPSTEENLQSETHVSFSLQKGQLRTNVCYSPRHSASLEVRHLPLDELELASLRGLIQRAEVQLNFQKRRGHGMLSVLHPKFSGVLGEALDVAARWSGDVLTVEKTVLEQTRSRYELQGEYVLPGTRDRHPACTERSGLLKMAMAGHLGSVISSMGRWRMRLEVPRAEVAEMLPLARLLSRSTDPAVLSRSKDLFMQSLQSVGLYSESLRDLLEELRKHCTICMPLDEVILEDITLPGLSELKGRWRGSLDASGGGNGDTMADFDFHGEDWEWGTYKTQRVQAVGAYSNNDGLRLEKIFIQRDNATIHADGTLLGPKTNLHFAVLNFPVGLVPTLVQVIESSASVAVHSLRQFLTPMKGILHMEGDLRGSLAKPECDVQVRLLDGAIGGIDLGRAEIVASLTSSSRFLFKANFEPTIQSGHVHIQGSVPVTSMQNSMMEEEDKEMDKVGAISIPGWAKEKNRGLSEEISEKKVSRDRNEEGWDIQLAESLKVLNWTLLDVGDVRVDADIKDGGMMLITALCPYANWLHGNADIVLQVRGTVEQPVLDGSASFHRASISSPVLREPITSLGGTVHVKSNRLCISSLESRVSRRGKLFVKGNLPLKTSEASPGDKIDLKCEVLEVRAKNILSGQVDSMVQVTGSILQPNISGMIKLSGGEAYLPHDKGNGAASFNRLTSNRSKLPSSSYNRMSAAGHVSCFFDSEPAASSAKFSRPSGKQVEVEKEMEQTNSKPKVDVHLTDLKLVLGPELRILYPLILNFAVSGELELNGLAHPKWIKPKGVLTFENGDVNLVATQVRLKREHLNVAKFEPDLGLDPILDLALVGSEWQFRIQSRASNWQDNLVVTSTRSVEQDVLSPMEAARVVESQLAESILEGDGQLAFKKLAAATLETLMPRIEGKGEIGQARWRLVHAPQIPSLLSLDPTFDPIRSLANISFGTEVEVQLGKRLQASISRQMKDSEMAMQWTLIYQLTSRLRVLLHSTPSKRLLFEYSATSQD